MGDSSEFFYVSKTLYKVRGKSPRLGSLYQFLYLSLLIPLFNRAKLQATRSYSVSSDVSVCLCACLFAAVRISHLSVRIRRTHKPQVNRMRDISEFGRFIKNLQGTKFVLHKIFNPVKIVS